jgi:hypothetical protein
VYWNHESAVVGNKDLRAYARRGGEVGLGSRTSGTRTDTEIACREKEAAALRK